MSRARVRVVIANLFADYLRCTILHACTILLTGVRKYSYEAVSKQLFCLLSLNEEVCAKTDI